MGVKVLLSLELLCGGDRGTSVRSIGAEWAGLVHREEEETAEEGLPAGSRLLPSRLLFPPPLLFQELLFKM